MHDLSKSDSGNFPLKLDVCDYVALAYPLDLVIAEGLDISALSVCVVRGEIISIWADMYSRS